jgi:hypothetical protein
VGQGLLQYRIGKVLSEAENMLFAAMQLLNNGPGYAPEA